MTDRCELRFVNGELVPCDEEKCIFWRVSGHLDLVTTGSGCAIQFYELLGENGAEIAAWLLSVKQRVEAEAQKDSDVADTA